MLAKPANLSLQLESRSFFVPSCSKNYWTFADYVLQNHNYAQVPMSEVMNI